MLGKLVGFGSGGSSGGGGNVSGTGTANYLTKWLTSSTVGDASWTIGATNGELNYAGTAKGSQTAPLIKLGTTMVSGFFISPDSFSRVAVCVDSGYIAEFTPSTFRLYDGNAGQTNGTYFRSSSGGLAIGQLSPTQDTWQWFVGSSASVFNWYIQDASSNVMLNITKSIAGLGTEAGQMYMSAFGNVPSGGSLACDQIDFINLSSGGGLSIAGVYKYANALTVLPRLDWIGAKGTCTTNASTTVTGVSTSFEYQFGIGDYLALSSAPTTFSRITSITSATALTTASSVGDGTSQTFVRRQAPLHIKDRNQVPILYCSPYGDIVLGVSSMATGASTGFLMMPSCGGTPTGTPETFTGRIPLQYDSTNNKLYAYNSGWKNVANNQTINGGTVVALTDGATPALNAATGTVFTLTAAGDRTIAVPSNPTDGQKIIIEHTASGGARTLSLNSGAGGFLFGTDITALTATTDTKTDVIGCIYNSTLAKWLVVAYVKGF